MRTAMPFARLATAALIAVALIAQFVASTRAAAARGWDVPGTVANFFSLFTVQANILVMAVLVWCALRQWLARENRHEAADIALVCVTTYALWVGLAYNVLLRSPPDPEGTRVVWSNEVVHSVVPLILLADLLLAPRWRMLRWRIVAVIPIYPLLWAAYTLLRGPLTPDPRSDAPFWYPYTFFNPHLVADGYATVAIRVLVGATIIAGMGFFVVLVWRWGACRQLLERERRPAASSADGDRVTA